MIVEKGKREEINILIVEDQRIVAEDLAVTLQDVGYQIAGIASTGEESIQLAQETAPNLVLMDIKLAGDIDGIEASERIRARLDIPVIFLTAFDEKDVLSRAKQTEPYGFLAKPFSNHILKITVETALHKHKADKRIKESEALYRALVDATDTGYVVLDQHGRVVEANSEYARLTGHKTVQEIIGRSVVEWTAERDKNRNAEAIKKCFSLGCIRNLEIEYQDANGKITPIEINASVINRDCGACIVTLCRDITDRKKADQGIRESEEKYRRLHETMMDAFVIVDMNGRIQETNQAYQAMLGYSEKELSRLTYIDLTPEEWHAFEASIVEEQILVKGYSDVYQKEYRKKDGTIFPIEIRTFLVRDNAGHPGAMWAVVRDITQRKLREKNLRESRERLQIVLDTIPAAVFQKDRNSVYVGANRAWLEAAGLNSSEEVLGKTDYDLPWDKDQADSYGEHDRKVMESGIPEYGIIEPFTRADGTFAWAKTSKVPLRDLEGNVVGILGTYEDITDRKRFQERLREYERVVEGLEEMIAVVDRDYRYVIANRAFLNYHGLEREQLVGRLVPEVLDKEVFDKVIKEKVDECLQL